MRQARCSGSAWLRAALTAISIAAGSSALGCGGGGDDVIESKAPPPAQCGIDEVDVEGKGCQCLAGLAPVEGGGCRPAGLPCDPDSASDASGCVAPGVPPQSCGQGFTADGNGGCTAILPEEKCPLGQMAIPGETACREVSACGNGTWGNIPLEIGTTQFVDKSFTGADSDGTIDKPWTTIQAAINAASPGELIAIAGGDYFESLVIKKQVRLWGKCPREVLVHKTAFDASQNGPVIKIYGPTAKGTEVHGLAISTNTDHGIEVGSSGDVLFEELWIYDTSFSGMIVKQNEGQITIRRSMIESARSIGVTTTRSNVLIEESVVRDTELDPIEQNAGVAVHATTSTLTIRDSVIEGNRQSSVIIFSSDATLERTVVRDTWTDEKGELGFGVMAIQSDLSTSPAILTVRSSVIERNKTLGIALFGAQGTIEATTIRDTLPDDKKQFGFGFYASALEETNKSLSLPSTATVKASLIENNHVIGAVILGSTASIESSIIRDTQPSPSSGLEGRGVSIEYSETAFLRANGTILSSLIERNQEMGVFVRGSDATISSSLIRDTTPNAAGRFGDGVVVMHPKGVDTTAHITALRVEGSARAGISNFGATVALGSTVLTCSAFDMEGEVYSSKPFSFQNLGGNACGCPVATESCEALSTGIEAPNPVPSPDTPSDI